MNIEICNYTKKLSKNLVLENINLSLSGGKIYGFVGKNGSGKTMLMRAICGLILPTSGFVKINNKIIGKDISFPDSVGALIENPGFISEYSGFQNLKILAQIQKKFPKIFTWYETKTWNSSSDDGRTSNTCFR